MSHLPGTQPAQVPVSLPTWGGRVLLLQNDVRLVRCQAVQQQKRQPLSTVPTTYPSTVEELYPVIAANTPVFHLHPRERYFPCTVEWFLDRAELLLVQKGWRRQVLQVLEPFGALSPATLRRAQEQYAARERELVQQETKRKQKQTHAFMMLRLDQAARAGQADCINDVPIYAHVKEVVDPLGRRDAIEINYMKFLAFNGSYKLFNTFYVGELGAHDADWEHITMRLSPDATRVLGIYYSAHRHRDGIWLSAGSVPREQNGQPRVFTALNGHGAYSFPGFIPRIFLGFNDLTSDAGPTWQAKQCVVVTQGKLPKVESRGSMLDGSSYSSGLQSSASSRAGSNGRAGSSVEVVHQPAAADWLAFEGRWGSTVVAPALQDWFARAEYPVSRTWLQQVFLPLWPGLESVWEPAAEELEELRRTMQLDLEYAAQQARDGSKGSQEMIEEMVAKARKEVHDKWEDTLKVVKKYSKRRWW